MDWTHPYPSARRPLLARNVVATSQALATQTGIEMLRCGGNAVDAALAAAITLVVTEPTCNGLGSDLFAIVHDGRDITGLNASGRSPAAVTIGRYAGLAAMPRHGWESVTIPGTVSGWAALSQRFGALPFADLFAPAIGYARNGFPVSPVVAAQWATAACTLPHDLGFADCFLPRGHAPAAGEFFACPALAATLDRIAATHGNAFYRGELAEAMVKDARAHGALHSLDDFATHAVDWVTPTALDFAGATVHEIPPNGQGIAAQMALGILRAFDVATAVPDSVESTHLQIEAMKLAFADVYRQVADPAAMVVDVAEMLDARYLASRAALIDSGRAQDFGPGTLARGGTVYLCAADARGMMVSLIQSNYFGFGSGVVVPGTGIAMQSRAAGFSLDPAHPNAIAGGKRPFHTIIPGFVTREGAALAAFGVMGGHVQPQAHVQTLTRLLMHGMNPQAVLDAPRWKLEGGLRVDLEPSAPPQLRAGLAALGHRVNAADEPSGDYGAGQFIVRNPEGGYAGGTDPRRDGQVAGF